MDFWVFGDSFSSCLDKTSWVNILNKKNKGKYYNTYSDAADTQTILDSFYKNLFNIQKDSLVVIWLPTLSRLRYPKSKEYFEHNFESVYKTNQKNNNLNITEYFSHWPYKKYPSGEPQYYLNFPFNYFDYSILDKDKVVNYNYNIDFTKSQIKQNIKNGVTPVDFAKFLNTNDATVQNWNNIFFSLKNFCNFEILFVSWTDEYNTENVVGKTQLTDEIGFWHTKDEEYKETNGEFGLESDEHLSTKMNKAFSEWVIKKYPNYFKK